MTPHTQAPDMDMINRAIASDNPFAAFCALLGVPDAVAADVAREVKAEQWARAVANETPATRRLAHTIYNSAGDRRAIWQRSVTWCKR